MYSAIKISIILFLIGVTGSAFAQWDVPPPVRPDPIRPSSPELSYDSQGISGPRIGIIDIQDREDQAKEVRNPISLFGIKVAGLNVPSRLSLIGWHFETIKKIRLSSSNLVFQTTILTAGLERFELLPSGSFIVALRTPNNYEFGFGGNISYAGTGFIYSLGKSFSYENRIIPVNLSANINSENIQFYLTTGLVIDVKFPGLR